jgi:hypothetical protein
MGTEVSKKSQDFGKDIIKPIWQTVSNGPVVGLLQALVAWMEDLGLGILPGHVRVARPPKVIASLHDVPLV